MCFALYIQLKTNWKQKVCLQQPAMFCFSNNLHNGAEALSLPIVDTTYCNMTILFYKDICKWQSIFLTFPTCFWIPISFFNLNSNCSNSLDMRNIQEHVKKSFCYQKLFTVLVTSKILQILCLQNRRSEQFGNKIQLHHCHFINAAIEQCPLSKWLTEQMNDEEMTH